MYPLVVLLGIASFNSYEVTTIRTMQVLSLIGIIISGYHSVLQLTATSGTCSIGSCYAIQYQLFGMLSIPNLAFIGFAGIFVMSLLAEK